MKQVYQFLLVGLVLLIFALPTFAQNNDSQQVTHIVQPGENLFRIALRYGVTMNDLATINNITDAKNIYSGQELLIPGLSLPAVAGETIETSVVENPLVAATPIIHVVQRGENLTQIAQKYGITLQDVMLANSLANPSRILAGEELTIWAPNYLDPAVQPTDIVAIATEEVENTQNASDPNAIIATPETQVVTADTSVERITHVVQQGEYLSAIARKYGISWLAIAEINNITDPNSVYAGTSLLIPNSTDIVSSQVAYESYAGTSVTPTEPGAHLGTGREIVVVLNTQMTYAYEDGVLKRSALVSTGLPGTPTVQGDYKVWNKTRSQTMTGPGYYLENVEWVMYFYQGYGLHGTWWHNNFGNPMSHGCVNMTNEDAEWFYNFGEVGTPVHVQFYA